MPTETIAPLLLLAFALLWCGACAVLSFVSGWKTLATRFRATAKPACSLLWMQSGEFNSVGYNGVLIVGVCDEGLYLAVVFPFGIGHVPLLIPYHELSPFVASKRGMWLPLYSSFVRVERFKKVSIAFHNRSLVNQIEAKLAARSASAFFKE